ncbi:MAG: helix-turn-helix domain-containing protein [Candidatus Puniceispirillaceae bacterium]
MSADTGKNTSSLRDGLLSNNSEDYGGKALRAVREKAGVSIEQLSFELRIPKNFIEALEAEQYDQLPGKTYGFGYLKSYCKFLNIEATPYLDVYKMRTSVSGTDNPYNFPDAALEPRMSGAMMAMLVVLALLSGYIGWQVLDRYQLNPLTSQSVIVAQEPSLTIKQDKLPVENDEIILDGAESSLTIATSEQGTVEADGTQAEQAEAEVTQTAALVVEDEAETANDQIVSAGLSEDKAQDKAEAAPDAPALDEKTSDDTVSDEGVQTVLADNQQTDVKNTTASAQATLRAPEEEIVISAKSAAWVEVVSENGDVILSKLFQAGEDYIAPANEKLYLSTGNAGALVLMIPGLDSFQAGEVGEIIRDLALSRESLRSRRSAVIQ